MKIFIIAQVLKGKKVIGYRLLDLESNNQVKDYPLASILNVLSNPQTSNIIMNAKVIEGDLIGTNGQLSRYAKIDTNGNLININESPLVIINKIDNIGYTVSDFKGIVKKMKNSDAVEYAKKFGIANGKIIIQDSIEYISSISDTYEQISISPSKVGTLASNKVKLAIPISTNKTSLGKDTEKEIELEMQYSDVFSSMSNLQKTTLKQYYTWYTVDLYEKMAKGTKLNIAPGKAAKLSQLRGIDKWKFAGINDSLLEGRFDAHCELGHKLRYEYFAIPEEDTKDSNIRTANKVGYFRNRRHTTEELRELGAIVFGETCASDFFEISEEDMKKLVKTRKTMSDEIELMSDIITNKLEPIYYDKCKELYLCIKALSEKNAMQKIFGDKVTATLIGFMQARLPFTRSLVILAADKIRKNKMLFFETVIDNAEINSLLKDIFSNTYTKQRVDLGETRNLLDYYTKFTIEGNYQYDPLNDKERTRRDVGAYNKDTRLERTRQVRNISYATLIKPDNTTLEEITSYIKLIHKLMQLSNGFLDYILNDTDKILKEKYNDESLYTYIKCKARDIKYTSLDEGNKLYFLTNSLGFNPKVRINSYDRPFGTYLDARNDDDYRFEKRIKQFNAFNCKYMQLFGEDIFKSNDKILEETIHILKDAIAKEELIKREKELDELNYFKVVLDDNSEFKELPFIKYSTLREMNELIGSSTDELTIIKDIKVNFSDIDHFEKITYTEYCDLERKRNRVYREIQEQKEKEQREKEQEQIEKEKEQREKEKEQREKEEDIKINDLEQVEKLLNTKEYDENNYGIKVVKDIIARKIPYERLTSKQLWRIDQVIKELSNDKNIDSGKYKLSDNKEVLDKINILISIEDKNTLDIINKASSIAIAIANTVNKKGEYSDRQLKHINKAYDAIKEVIEK